MTLIGAFLLFFIGCVHSYLGEKYILIRLFRRDNLPKLSGSDWLTKRILRFAWHITTLAWWGFGAILYLLSGPVENLRHELFIIIAVVFALSGAMSLVFSRGKHLSWLVFFMIAATSVYGSLYS